MAITRQDYKYVHNTLDRRVNKQSDGSLSVGSVVKNLLPELRQENIYNPNYTEYYGDDLSSKWLIPVTDLKIIAENRPLSFARDLCDIEVVTNYMRYTISYSQNTGIVGGHDLKEFEGTIQLSESAVGGRVISQIGAQKFESGYVGHNQTISYRVTCDRDVDLEIEYQETKYIVQTRIDHNEDEDAILSYNIEVKNSLKLVEMNKESDHFGLVWSFYGKATESNGSYTGIEDVLNKKTINYIINMQVRGSAISDPMEYGVLKTTVKLQPNTSYCLHVINQTPNPNKAEQASSHLSQSEKSSSKFNGYLFFNTGNTQQNTWEIEIPGISFGYEVYNKNDSGVVVDYRPIKTSLQAKVFLFESNLPWVVDDKGIIIGVVESSLVLLNPTPVDSTKAATLSEDALRQLFSTKPQLELLPTTENGQNEIIITPQNFNKYEQLWKQSLNNTKGLAQQIRLVVYRDHLIEKTHDYNERPIKQRRGLLRNIYKEINEETTVLGNISPIVVASNGVTIRDGDLNVSYNNGRYYAKTIPMMISTLGLLGNNYEYMVNKNLDTSEYDKYTSICFAWAIQQGFAIERISDFSETIFINTDALTSKKNEEKTILSLSLSSNYTWIHKEKTNDSYYNGGWYFDKTTPE